MDANSDQHDSGPRAAPLLEYATQRPPSAPPRRPDAIAAEFARATFLLTAAVVVAFMFLAAEAPDTPLAGLCAVVGTSGMATAIGGVTLWVSTQIRHALLGDRVRVRSQGAVIAVAATYVSQLVAIAVLAQWIVPGDRRVPYLGYVPLAPLVAPLWLMPRRAA